MTRAIGGLLLVAVWLLILKLSFANLNEHSVTAPISKSFSAAAPVIGAVICIWGVGMWE